MHIYRGNLSSTLYRGNNNTFISFKNQLIEILSQITTSKIIIVGDININRGNDIKNNFKLDCLSLMAQLGFHN